MRQPYMLAHQRAELRAEGGANAASGTQAALEHSMCALAGDACPCGSLSWLQAGPACKLPAPGMALVQLKPTLQGTRTAAAAADAMSTFQSLRLTTQAIDVSLKLSEWLWCWEQSELRSNAERAYDW